MTRDEDLVHRSLAVLRNAPEHAEWPEVASLKRVVLVRRRRRIGGGAIAVAAAAAMIATLVVVPGRPTHAQKRSANVDIVVAGRSGAGIQLVARIQPARGLPDDGAQNAVANAEQVFSLALLRQVSRGSGSDNVTLAPASLALALAMLANGARGSTLREIVGVLGGSSLSVEQQNRGWASLLGSLAAADEQSGATLQSANSLWLQKNLPMAPQFMAVMAQYFRTGVWQVDFAHDLSAALRSLDGWASRQTSGRITRLFEPGDIDPSTLLVLANAVSLKGSWQLPFDPKRTANGPFHAPGGRSVTAKFMARDSASGTSNSRYDAVQLPYAGGRFTATMIMPKGQSLRSFVASLTPARFTQLRDGMKQQVGLRLPRFTIGSYTNLNSSLIAMGMPTAFTTGADFSALTTAGPRVHAVAQRDYLSVGEYGTEAAATTGVAPSTGSLKPPRHPVLTFDRPFLFLIRDIVTGTVLFTSQVQNPGA